MKRAAVACILLAVLLGSCQPAAQPKKGVGVGWDVGTQAEIDHMSYWHYNWGASRTHPDYVPMVWCRLSQSHLDYATENPGKYWLIQNEPNNSSQCGMPCGDAGQEAANAVNAIAGVDPTAKFLLGGIWNWNNHIAYSQCYQQAFDVYHQVGNVVGWHLHIYHEWDTWNPYNKDLLFNEFVGWVEEWRDHFPSGELWITEFGPLGWYGLTWPDVVLDYMSRTTAWMENGNAVQRYAWFALKEYPPAGFEYAWLFDASGDITQYGEEYGVSPTPTPTPQPTPDYPEYDLNRDCVVDVADVMLVASCWREVGSCLQYDFDGDGRITVVDIMKVVATWGEECS